MAAANLAAVADRGPNRRRGWDPCSSEMPGAREGSCAGVGRGGRGADLEATAAGGQDNGGGELPGKGQG